MTVTPTPPETLSEALASRYQLKREIGRGGMATVYLATDVKHRREVAVKVLKPDLAASLGADRFLREMACRPWALRLVSHPFRWPEPHKSRSQSSYLR